MKMRALLLVMAVGFAQFTCVAPPALAQQHGLPSGTVTLDAATTVPFVLADGHIYVAANVNGHPFAFVFDTGGQAAITHEVQTALNPPLLGHANIPEAGNAILSTDLVRLDSFKIGKAEYDGATAIVLPRGFPHGNPIPGLSYGGIIGREFFSHLVTTIDYERHTLSFVQPAAFVPNRAAAVLPLTMRNGVFPNVSASIDGHDGSFDVDAGSAMGIILMQRFAELNKIRGRGRTLNTDIGRGLGGYIAGTATRAEALRIGTFQIKEPIVMVSHAKSGVFAEPGYAGNIGTQVLSRFTLTIDVPGSRLYLLPNSSLGNRLAFNRSGMTVRVENGERRIVAVAPDSPAFDAKIKPGDVITAVNGTSVSSISNAQLNDDWLRPAGTAVTLNIRRNGRAIVSTIRLRDVI